MRNLDNRIARLERERNQQAQPDTFQVIIYDRNTTADAASAAFWSEHPGYKGALFVLPRKERQPSDDATGGIYDEA